MLGHERCKAEPSESAPRLSLKNVTARCAGLFPNRTRRHSGELCKVYIDADEGSSLAPEQLAEYARDDPAGDIAYLASFPQGPTARDLGLSVRGWRNTLKGKARPRQRTAQNIASPALTYELRPTALTDRPKPLGVADAFTEVMPKPKETRIDSASIYFSDDNVTLYHGDCLEVMEEQVAPQSVDIIFADPPYNLSNGGFTCHAGRMVPVHKGDWDKSSGQEADLEFIEAWLSRCQKILKPSGTIWVSGTQHVIFNVGYMMQRLGYHILNTVTWFKPNASPNLSCRFFTHSSELLIWAAPQRRKKLEHIFNYETMRAQNGGRQMRDVWEFQDGDYIPRIFEIGPPKTEEKRFGKHPTQKPEALLERLILSSTREDRVVLDPFNGSGTTGVVASKLGRRYIGIELDEKYLSLTLKRLAASKDEKQLGLPQLQSAASLQLGFDASDAPNRRANSSKRRRDNSR